MDIIANLVAAAKRRNQRVVLPEGHDHRILLAARRLRDEGVANAIVLGERDRLEDVVRAAGVSLEGITTIDPESGERREDYAEAYARGPRPLDIQWRESRGTSYLWCWKSI